MEKLVDLSAGSFRRNWIQLWFDIVHRRVSIVPTQGHVDR